MRPFYFLISYENAYIWVIKGAFLRAEQGKKRRSFDHYSEKQNRDFGFPKQGPDLGFTFYIVNNNLC